MNVEAMNDHNDPRWLIVSYAPPLAGRGTEPGWYVIRICPCHLGERVTVPYTNKEWAEDVRECILEVGRDAGTTP
jgi:hypothetical protein